MSKWHKQAMGEHALIEQEGKKEFLLQKICK